MAVLILWWFIFWGGLNSVVVLILNSNHLILTLLCKFNHPTSGLGIRGGGYIQRCLGGIFVWFNGYPSFHRKDRV